MTDRQFRSLCQYILDAAVKLGLRDWSIDIHLGSDDGAEAVEGQEIIASVDCSYGRKQAHIYIHPAFHDADSMEQRHVVIHELVHIHNRQLIDLLWTAVKPVVGEGVWSTLGPTIRLLDEHAVDAIATALEPTLPLWNPK